MSQRLSRDESSRDVGSLSPPAAAISAGAVRLIRNASSRSFMRESSIRVRQTAEEEVEQRQSDLAYSWPVVVLDLLWNSAFLLVSFIVLALAANENPSAPLRVWILGYAIQCCVHMVCVWYEYRRRQQLRERAAATAGGLERDGSRLSGSRSEGDAPLDAARVSVASEGEIQGSLSESLLQRQAARSEVMARTDSTTASSQENSGYYNDDSDFGAFWNHSLARQVETLNTMFSFVWWVIGLGWVLSTFDDSFQDSPLLSWLCMIFLAFDIFFVIFCAALACVIGLAVCCCLPCIIAILYAVGTNEDGAPPEVIEALPKFRFQHSPSLSQDTASAADDDADLAVVVDQQVMGGVLVPVNPTLGAKPRPVAAEDAECCICLCSYEDGAELRELPCGHHFDQTCLDKWLRTKPTCPLCKYDIVSGGRPESAGPSTPVSPAPLPDPEVGESVQEGERAPNSLATLLNNMSSSARGFFSAPSAEAP